MPNYDLIVTPTALQFIREFHKKHFPTEPLAIVLSDLHPIGSVLVVDMRTVDAAEENTNYREILKKGYKNYPFAVYLDTQSEREGCIPPRMMIDLIKTTKGIPTLTFKNPDFES